MTNPIPIRIARSLATVLVCLFLVSLKAFGATVLYIGQPGPPDHTRQQISAAAAFYGLEFDELAEVNGHAASLPSLSSTSLVAIVIAADALPTLSPEQTFDLLHRRRAGLPLLIAGITDRTSTTLLQSWSGGTIAASRRSPVISGAAHYQVGNVPEITRQLSGFALPLKLQQVFYLVLSGPAQPLLQASFSGSTFPVFARTESDGAAPEIFFATEQPDTDTPVSPDPYRAQPVFAAFASPLLFLRYAAGDHAWHTSGNYANFTIDDIWLREPYGHVNYQGLLDQAQQHRFHATVAFIPWNFDRSQPAVATLFRDHPDFLSICVHGNDHVHQEFGPLSSHPLDKQAQKAEQALARMDRFTQLTHIAYDPVMVFPHSIAPAATFSVLHRDNYLATVNSLNVPSDASAPPGLDFALRPVTLQFSSFPSLRRYSAETDIPTPQLAIDAFLGNPMLFYSHESFFASGIGAFNRTADVVNRLQPSMRWSSLGEIVQHLYVERVRDDGGMDIRALSGSLRLRNDRPQDAIFFLDKQEDPSFPLTVLVDGKPFPSVRTGDHVTLQLPIAAGKVRLIEFRVPNATNLATIDISRSSPRTNAIRLLSDFRDNFVSDTRAGRWFIRSYADHGRPWDLAFALLSLLAVLLIAAHLSRRRKTFSTAPAPLAWKDASMERRLR
jgi:hypothetical protein